MPTKWPSLLTYIALKYYVDSYKYLYLPFRVTIKVPDCMFESKVNYNEWAKQAQQLTPLLQFSVIIVIKMFAYTVPVFGRRVYVLCAYYDGFVIAQRQDCLINFESQPWSVTDWCFNKWFSKVLIHSLTPLLLLTFLIGLKWVFRTLFIVSFSIVSEVDRSS